MNSVEKDSRGNHQNICYDCFEFSFFFFFDFGGGGLWMKLLSSAGVAFNHRRGLYFLTESEIIWNL